MTDALRHIIRNSSRLSFLSFGSSSMWTKDSESAAEPPADQTAKPTPQEQRMIALLAEVHEKTVARYARGEPVRPSSRLRIERALLTIRNLKAL